jgi:DNA repair protein RadC
VTYRRRKYRAGEFNRLSAAEPPQAPSLDAIPVDLRNAGREWLAFVPVDDYGTQGRFQVVARGEKDHVHVHPAELFRKVLSSGARGTVFMTKRL